MAQRLIGTDSTDPWLPDVVKVKADRTRLADTAGNFASTDVEGALAELSNTIDDVVVSGGGMPAASDAETITGTSTAKAVTPAGLKYERPYVDVRSYGATGDGTTDDTAALQAAITAAVAVRGTVIVPAGVYKFSTLSIGGPVTIRGTGAKMSGQPTFGQPFLTWTAGAVLVSTATTGEALYASASHRGITLADFALIGPGTGTSTGLVLGHPSHGAGSCIRCYVERVIVGNFAVGVYLGLENSQTDGLFVLGCLTGIQTGNAHNGNTHNATDIETCTDFALLLQDADTNMWSGGVMQSNCPSGGTVVAIDRGVANSFHNIYFENAGAAYSFDIGHTAGLGDYNTIDDCHITAPTEKIRIVTNHNRIIGNAVYCQIQLNGTGGNFLRGNFLGGITGTPSDHFIFDEQSTIQLANRELRLASTKKLYIETTGTGSYLWRSSSANTELNAPNGVLCQLTVGGVAKVAASSTGVGFNGSTPVAKAANPGTAAGSDAAVINAIVTALRNLGLVT